MFPTSFDGLSPYADQILRLRKKMQITQISQLFDMLYTKTIPQEFLDLIGDWEKEKGEPRDIWNLIIQNGCNYNHTMKCNQRCCKY